MPDTQQKISHLGQCLNHEWNKYKRKRTYPSIISNVTAKEESDVNVIKDLLIDQITSRVRWRESVQYMINNGVRDFIEIGPGKVLSSLVKKINKDVKLSNINTIENIKNDWI